LTGAFPSAKIQALEEVTVDEDLHQGLSRRQRQVIDAVYPLRAADVEQVRRHLPDAPSYSAVRATLDILTQRGFLTRQKNGRKHLYLPSVPRSRARLSVLGKVLESYFGNSVQDAVTALISVGHARMAPSDYEELIALISKAMKKEERKNARPGTKRR
jgi:BlaI family transcriptional regulator, penicillinase repressor